MTLALIITIAVCFFITWIVIACNSGAGYPIDNETAMKEHDWYYHENERILQSRISFLEDQVSQKDKHIEMLCMDLDYMRRRKHYQKTTDFQEIADLFEKALVPIEELKEKFAMKIN